MVPRWLLGFWHAGEDSNSLPQDNATRIVLDAQGLLWRGRSSGFLALTIKVESNPQNGPAYNPLGPAARSKWRILSCRGRKLRLLICVQPESQSNRDMCSPGTRWQPSFSSSRACAGDGFELHLELNVAIRFSYPRQYLAKGVYDRTRAGSGVVRRSGCWTRVP